MFVCVWVCEGLVERACKRTFKGDECVKTSIKFCFLFCFFNQKSLVILYFIPHKESFFGKGREGEKMCRKQFGYQVLFSSVFFLLLIPVITLFFMQLLLSSSSLSIGSYSVCVCIYRDDMFIQKGKDCLSGPAEIWFFLNVLKATLEIRVWDVNILLNHPITDLHPSRHQTSM